MTSRKAESKLLSISSKRQITIPQKFYQELGFSTEAECTLRKDELVIRPVRVLSGADSSEKILEGLIAEGLTGKELLKAFKNKKREGL